MTNKRKLEKLGSKFYSKRNKFDSIRIKFDSKRNKFMVLWGFLTVAILIGMPVYLFTKKEKSVSGPGPTKDKDKDSDSEE